ncbi:thermonuclease family protein [Terrihabitans rhizophilus]|uniref:Thermonuclease family protein n=1 Tax=Terrihabitans rhizophilus TaxID=3092662 RepID=A0ABU4RQK7_9HYPH|nr:thermonuclease family protein [Terrihabitans sp. PJ23]MDX6807126.1 thermonuclease family protein [Terrihabitans sp. PJ23]
MTYAPAILVAALFFTTPVLSADIVGRASTVDGDTIEIHGQRIRLWGVDAPEAGQSCAGLQDRNHAVQRSWRCGKAAADTLDDMLASARPTSCEAVDTDRYGRTVARCAAGGRDVARMMVEKGLAVDYPQYSKGAYADAEREAKAARRGMWAGTFVMPWDWRKGAR